MGLHIGVSAVEQFFGAVNGQLLGLIYILAAAIIATARIAFGIFIGHHAALGFKHSAANNIFRRDQLNFILLTQKF